ncbi:MAG: hypothetical protein ABW202_01485 [Duganella sp.]
MARIIPFPKIHPRFCAPPAPPQDARPRSWLAWLLALLVCALAAPVCLVLIVLVALMPMLAWVLVIDVIVQLVRIFFIGGAAAISAWLHLATLLVAAILVVALGKSLDKSQQERH